MDTVAEEGLTGFDDATVWPAAQQAERFLITQDLDFSDIRKFLPGTHHGLLLVRLNVPGRLNLTERITRLFATEPVETCRRSFVILTEHKVRTRRPPPGS